MSVITKLHALLDKIEIADYLHEEQSAALEFALYGRDLLRVVEAAQLLTTDQFSYMRHIKLTEALNRLKEEDV
jgi:hypothetical protein